MTAGPDDVRQLVDQIDIALRSQAAPLEQLTGYPCIRPHGGWSLLIDTHSMRLPAEEAAQRLFTKGQIAATPMTGWGPSGSRYLRLVFANEPAERLADLRARFDTALS